MTITITGYIIIIFSIFFFLKNGIKRCIIDPRIFILLFYWIFWGKIENIPYNLSADILLAVSFLLFWFSMILFSKLKYSKITNALTNISSRLEKGEFTPLSHTLQIKLVLVVFLYCISDIAINSYIYGGVTNAMTRFYYRLPEQDVPQYYTSLLSVFSSICSFILFTIRLSNIYFKQKKALFYIGLLALLFVTFPTGSRGAVLKTLLLPFFADIVVICFLKGNWKSLLNGVNFVVVGVFLFAAFFLTKNRNKDFDSLQDVSENLVSFNINEGVQSYQDKEKDLMMWEYYNAYDQYGNTIPFYPITYTLTAICLNPIPRNIYPNKPLGIGRILAFSRDGVYIPDNKFLLMNRSSFAVGICGEGWINGGLPGVIFYSLLLGMFAGFCVKMYRVLLSYSYLNLMFALLFMKCSFSYIRGDILSGVTQGVYPIIATFFLLLLITKLNRNSIHF